MGMSCAQEMEAEAGKSIRAAGILGFWGFFGQKDKRSLKGGSLKRGSCGGPKGLKEMV